MCGGNGTWPDGKLDCCANGDTICQCIVSFLFPTCAFGMSMEAGDAGCGCCGECCGLCFLHGLTCGYWGYYRRTLLRQKLGLPEPESCFCEYMALCCPIYTQLGIAQQWRAASATKK
jgi:Cys-rich protein (TIGR01571 family)